VTPLLAAYRDKFGADRGFEVIFISSDKEQSQFDEYHATMPWPALDFADRELKNNLALKFRITGIPSLLVFDPSGALITSEGVQSFMEDEECTAVPWRPKPFSELAAGPLVRPDGSSAPDFAEATKGKVVAIYFSAHWCGPCKAFTPRLTETYKLLQEKGKNFEVIFVSSDRDPKAFADYHATMPWLAVPFEDSARRAALSRHFEVRGIPSLVILGEDGTVSRKAGRAVIMKDPRGEAFPWIPQPIEELDDPNPINEGPCLVVFADGSKCPPGEELIATLTPGAQRVTRGGAAYAEDDTEVTLFVASEDDGLIESVRGFAKIKESDEPRFVLFDVPQQVKYVLPEGTAATAEEIERIVTAYRKGELEGKRGIRE
jgi:nucleoredoxin